MTTTVTATVPARVGLAGNPSDLYDGRVVAFALAGLATTVTVTDAPDWRLPDEGHGLVAATIARVAARHGPLAPAAVTIATDVPRRSGLSGSSAIVIALLRALSTRHGIPTDPFRLAEEALAVERDDLGITAGPQDRVVQAYGGLVDIDLRRGLRPDGIRRLDPELLPEMLIAWTGRPGRDSGDVHRDVYARWLAGDDRVRAAANRWAELAGAAVEALRRRDRTALGAAMDENAELRRSLFAVSPDDLELLAVARSHGAAAKLCGSGGSIVALPLEATDLAPLEAAHRQAGHHTRRVAVALPPSA